MGTTNSMQGTIMKTSLFLLLALFFAATDVQAQDLRLRIIKAAHNDLEKIFADQKGGMSDPDLSLVSQMDDMLGGPPEGLAEVGDNIFFFAACRAQSCAEKAAILIDMNEQKLLAGAFRHFHCVDKQGTKPKCDAAPTVSAYYFSASEERRHQSEKMLTEWSRKVGGRYLALGNGR